ncbi:MAG: hypothetical protein HYV95_01140 [Opitutae bacterium]|nr:hypothetical protein [Opitutae bacterium]
MSHRFSRARFPFVCFVCFMATFTGLRADPLTKQTEIDFGREVASRNLKGLATRSDGRVLPGPVFTDLAGPKIADILWTLRPAGANRFLVGTGPDGKVFEVAFNPKDSTYAAREVADVNEAQAIAVQPLADGSFLIGTSPTAAVYVARDGKLLARVPLPADSVFDFLALPDGSVLASTGNPGKIYRLDPAKLAKAGVIEGKIGDGKVLADKGVTLFAEVRDRNVRRLARLSDGRVVAGSSPKGNVYAFAATGGAPALLQEGRDAEVLDFLPQDDGSFYAAIVQSPGEVARIVRTKPAIAAPADDSKDDKDAAPPAFGGRSTLVRFPVDGFPETVVSRAGISLYRVAQHKDWLVMTAGEQGDTLGYDPVARRALTFAGSASAQLNDLAPLGDGRFLALRNNAPGLALLSFVPAPARELETKRLDLGAPSELGLIRFARVRGLDLAMLKLEARTNFGSDELEGWTAWTELKPRDDAFSAEGLRGRYLKLRLTVPASAGDFQIDKATVFSLPQNHRPQLNDFRIFPANLGLVPAPEPGASVITTLGQVLFPGQQGAGKDEVGDKRKNHFLGSQVVPQNGAQVIYWSVSDSDGDNLAYTLSLRPETSDTWTDLAVETRDSYVQFETGGLAEGLYLTHLTVTEQAPRPEKQRLTYAFETDYLTIDRTPPAITDAKAERRDGKLVLTVIARDALSLLEGAEFVLNNGTREQTEHPTDGILDGKTETFVVEFAEPKAAGASSVEIIVYDASGNSSSKRLPVK